MKLKVTVGGVVVECEAAEDPWASPLPTIGSMGPTPDNSRSPRVDYDKRMGIIAKHHLTVGDPIDATWIVDRVKERITGKTVVEIGAGVGYLAVELAKHARHVFAIEADVRWSWQFAEKLYETKPRNLTWIFDRAENVADVLKLHTDVAIVVTGSDDIWLREIAAKMADDVILPWQQYNGGKAVVSTGGLSFDE